MFAPAPYPPRDAENLMRIITGVMMAYGITRSYDAHDGHGLAMTSLGLGIVVLTGVVPRRLRYDVQERWLVIQRAIGSRTRRFPVREATVTTVTPVFGRRLRGGYGQSGWPTDPNLPLPRDGIYRVDGKPAEVYASANGPGLLLESPTFRVFVTPADLEGMRAALERGGATLA
jgi:hypothetical protein